MRIVLLALAMTAALALPAAAQHCWSVSAPEVQTGHTPAGAFYVDNDLCQLECLSSMWIYQESNGIDGLQRGDAIVDETCHGLIEADTLVLAVYV